MESRFHEDCFSIDCGFRRVQGDDWLGCLRVGILPTEQMHKTEPQWLRKFMVHFCAREKNRLNKLGAEFQSAEREGSVMRTSVGYM